MSNEQPHERRQDARVCPKGTVILHADTYVIRGRIANVSRTGLHVATRVTAPERLLGAVAELALRLDGSDASWLELRGRLLRIGACSVAIRLEDVPPSFTRIIDQAVSRSAEHHDAISVVLVDPMVARRSELAGVFRAQGCQVLEVATPLEAIVRLGESHFEPDLIAIADSMPTAISDDLRRFVDQEHSRAALVTIGEAPDALSAADGELAARIRDVLNRFSPLHAPAIRGK